MDLITAGSLLGIMLVLAAMPSASVALVVTRSAMHGFRHGVAVSVGIVLGDLVFVAIALLGMSFLAETLGAFFVVLKYCGGAYLIWLGITLLRAKASVELGADRTPRASLAASCLAGFVLTLGDVKAIFFYASLFPSFVDMANLNAATIIWIVFVTVVAVGGVKAFYACMAERIVRRLQGQSAQRMAQKTAGAVLVGAGAYLIGKA